MIIQGIKSLLSRLSVARGRSLAGTAMMAISLVITLAALFVDGFPPPSWKSWLGIKDPKPVVAAMVPQRVVPGQVTVTIAKPRGNDSSVSPAPLPLVLVSTRVGRNSHEGFAQLGVDATSPQTYTAGAVLANGARLSEVYANYVVLERNGQSVRLYLQGNSGPSEPAGLSSLTTVGGAPPVPVLAPTGEALADFIRPSPVFEGSALMGYQVYPGKDAAAFEALGLEAGDVLVSINGTAIVKAEAALSQLQSLVTGTAMIVGVRRAGAVKSLSLDGAVLVEATQRHSSPPAPPAARTSST